MDDELELPEALDKNLEKGVINISQGIGTHLSLREVLHRVHRHFQNSDFGYRQVSDDTFKLKARSRKYPLFGSYTGQVHVFENLGAHSYAMEGLLQFRMSVLWFLGVTAFFFLLIYFTHPGLWVGALFETAGTGFTIYTTYKLGLSTRDEVEERVEASCLFLRSTIENIR